jgi:sugar phosphate isomerase/epimerase
MKLGAMDIVLGNGADAANFERARRLGLAGVEVNLRVAELKQPDCGRPGELAKLSEKHGVAIPSLVLGEHNSGGLATWWRGREADEEVSAALRWGALLKAKTLLVPFFFLNEPKGKTHRAAVAERLKPLCGEAERGGVVLAFEGVLRAEHLKEMADLIGSPAFGVYFDVANITWCDLDPVAEIRALGSLIRQVHAKEAKVFTGDARLGEGRVDHVACAAALREIRYDRWLVLETPGGGDEEVARDIAFARRVYGAM